MDLKLIEPLSFWFKDEVPAGRGAGAAGRDGLASSFPGPGLAVRVLGK